jgi:hypothetical protein
MCIGEQTHQMTPDVRSVSNHRMAPHGVHCRALGIDLWSTFIRNTTAQPSAYSAIRTLNDSFELISYVKNKSIVENSK